MQHYLQSKFRWASALLDPCKLLAVHVYIFLHRKKINIKIHQSISIEIITLSFVVRSLSIPLLLVWDQVIVGGGKASKYHIAYWRRRCTTENLGHPVNLKIEKTC